MSSSSFINTHNNIVILKRLLWLEDEENWHSDIAVRVHLLITHATKSNMWSIIKIEV